MCVWRVGSDGNEDGKDSAALPGEIVGEAVDGHRSTVRRSPEWSEGKTMWLDKGIGHRDREVDQMSESISEEEWA